MLTFNHRPNSFSVSATNATFERPWFFPLKCLAHSRKPLISVQRLCNKTRRKSACLCWKELEHQNCRCVVIAEAKATHVPRGAPTPGLPNDHLMYLMSTSKPPRSTNDHNIGEGANCGAPMAGTTITCAFGLFTCSPPDASTYMDISSRAQPLIA